MANVGLQFLASAGDADPQSRPLLLLGQLHHLHRVPWSHVRGKLQPRVTEEVSGPRGRHAPPRRQSSGPASADRWWGGRLHALPPPRRVGQAWPACCCWVHKAKLKPRLLPFGEPERPHQPRTHPGPHSLWVERVRKGLEWTVPRQCSLVLATYLPEYFPPVPASPSVLLTKQPPPTKKKKELAFKILTA